MVAYYPIDVDSTNFHPVYGEAIIKTFLPPIRVHALIKWGGLETTSESYGVDKNATLEEPKELFGRAGENFEIVAKCIRAREGLFDGQ